MADPSPLLPPPTPQPHAQEAPSLFPNLDDTIEQCIGSIGVAQVFQAFIVAFAFVFEAQQIFINVFTDRRPTWHCVDTSDATCSSTPYPCRLPDASWAWDQPAHTSIVSEWRLGCYSSSSVSGIPASAFFVGSLLGGLVIGTLGDSSLGRKKMLWSATMATSITGILTAFTPNVWMYVGLRFVTGFSRATITTSVLVLSTEIIGKKWRGRVLVLSFLLFTLGFLSLPAIAYVNEASSWRTVYLWVSFPAFCHSILVFFFVHESPRWLLIRGRREEAIRTLNSIACTNGRSLTRPFLDLVVPHVVAVDGGGGLGLLSALKVLLKSRWALQRLAAMMPVALGVGMGYFGMPLGLGNLGFNLYLSVTFNAVSEIPSTLVTFLLIEHLNRRSSLLVTTLATGAASLACVFVRDHVMRMVVEVAAYFGSCIAFDTIMIYTLELFPTCVRNSAMVMVRQALVLGGALAPFLVATGNGDDGGFLSFGVIGLTIACFGLLVVCLPETRGGGICDTMEEQEHKEIAAADPSAIKCSGAKGQSRV